MKTRDWLEMLLLAALWGASFLFLRVASPVVGPTAVAAFRVIGGALLLWPFVLRRGQWHALRGAAGLLLVSGLLSCALPFIGLSQAARSLPAGLLSILNATTPLWGGLIGWLWRGEQLGRGQVAGLLIGLGGVSLLMADRSQFQGAAAWTGVALALGSTLMYALAIHHSKRYLSGLPPLAVTAGSLSAAGLLLAGPAWVLGPRPSPQVAATLQAGSWAAVPGVAWLALAGLAVLCTGVAYVLFYRLLARVGPTQAMTVTFLIPVFGMLWGALFLHETITWGMLGATAVIVAGTLLSNRMAPRAASPALPATVASGQATVPASSSHATDDSKERRA